MNAFLNYLIEANLALLIVLLMYMLLLRKETNFRLIRLIMLVGILSALVFPLLHFENAQQDNAIPALNQVIPSNWLPEVVITDGENDATQLQIKTSFTIWKYAGLIYWLGLGISTIVFVVQLISLVARIPKNYVHQYHNVKIVEVPSSTLTFSFFNFIFIGTAKELSVHEKQQMVEHERVHINQWHSLDILLITAVKMLFWFNPFISLYKKIFVQLHEFEADARAVENQDVNRYCNLLARVALQSAGIPLGNHFNNSLTIKRIQMMKTIKSKIRGWKIIACSAIVPILFFFIACQDQITRETKPNIPAEAQERFSEFKKKYPGETFIVEYDENADAKMAALDNKYGKAAHIELFTIQIDGKFRDFSMIQYDPSQEKIFTVVEQQPEFPGGIDSLMNFLRRNIRYPFASRQAGHEGTIYVEMVIDKDGSVTGVKTMAGLDATLDAEAMRVVKLLPRWKPGSQNGREVRTQFIIPITFRLDAQDHHGIIRFDPIQSKENEMKVLWTVRYAGNKRIASGQVLDESGNPLKGTNLVIKGTTYGVTTESDGKFSLEIPEGNGEVAVSFIGYKTTSLSF
jgi:TonB family protein